MYLTKHVCDIHYATRFVKPPMTEPRYGSTTGITVLEEGLVLVHIRSISVTPPLDLCKLYFTLNERAQFMFLYSLLYSLCTLPGHFSVRACKLSDGKQILTESSLVLFISIFMTDKNLSYSCLQQKFSHKATGWIWYVAGAKKCHA